MADKMTKKDYFKAIADFIEASDTADKEEWLNFIDTQIELIDKKAAKAKETAAKKKEAGDELRDKVESVLTGDWQTADQITAQVEYEDVTKSKVVSRLTALVNAGIAQKEQQKVDSKKVMAYKLA